ncbi:phage minor tail protein L [Pseudodesulfovibrio sp. JC047]|uniref:phage minor tail protein L n=1 Tax=Pseudodesulfovibrio sp. JC047 TaxID=2683199 RepID=UPI0013CFABAB|nr:phage minor tail protein L [Pseudodesulfovibrio sp. JC047]NDV20821.1 phage minor tail protein L [Pseudodesulfovibrio sp. JC047]
MTISNDVQKSSPGVLVELFDLDATAIGGEVQHFIKGTKDSQPVTWKGNIYIPLDLESDGFEMNAQGSLPRPTLRVSHVNTAFIGMVEECDDLIGATLTRWRTFSRYLDTAPEADSNAHFAPDIYRVDQLTEQNKLYVEWELAAAMDHEGRKLPGRQILRDVCTHRYRVWNGSSFDYSKATCPYTASTYFDHAGVSTADPAKDRCGKRLSDCELRFPGEPLPTRAFPGVGRLRP